MLDVRSKEVLKHLISICGSSYQVIEIADICEALQKKYRLDKDMVVQIVRHLASLDYISVKYQDSKVFCLTSLPLGRQLVEAELDSIKNRKKIKTLAKGVYIAVLVCALIGSFLGTLIYYMIF